METNINTDPWNGSDGRFVQKRKYDIKALWERHNEIIRRVALGQSNNEIGDALGVTPQTVSNTKNSPMARDKIQLFRAELDAESLDIAQRIQDFAPKALQLLEDVIEGRYEDASLSLRTKYASAHLGRAGFGEVKKINAIHTTLSREDIERIKERAVRAAQEAGVIDMDFVGSN
jgi:hypothetical protein